MANVNSALNYLNGTIETFGNNVDVHVRNVDSSTREIEATAGSILHQVKVFSDQVQKGEMKQIAHENIMRIDQIIKEQFGNYDAIRKTIMGVVRDFDINLVRNSTIEELSEELWITSSRYWLSYALLAVTAWVNNYPDVAKNALSESCRKDAIKTSLFFCLFNLRFGRNTTAKEWFKVYCRTLDPTMLQQEAGVMIQAFMNGVFGKDKQLEHEVVEIVNDWIRIISEDAEISAGLVLEYETYFENFGNTGTPFNYPMIEEFCRNSDELRKSFINVSKYDRLIELVDSINVESQQQTDDNYRERVDAVLMNLITNYDQEELELRNQQEEYRFLVENDGDKELADRQYAEFMARQDDSFNIGKQLVSWVLDRNETTDPSIRRFGLQSTKAWFQGALENWTIHLRESCPLQYRLSIDTWNANSNGRDLDEQRTSMKNHFENNKFKAVYANTFNIAFLIAFFVSLIITVASVVHTVKNGFTVALVVGVVLMIASAIAVLVYTGHAKKKYQKRVDAAVYNLENTMAQIVEFQRYFSENIRKKDDVLARISFI